MMIWWRLEVNDAGVFKCAQHDGVRTERANVYYVEAETETIARQAAIDWYENDKAKRREAGKRHEERRKKTKQCRNCEKKLAPGSIKFCQEHLDAARKYQRDYYHNGPLGKRQNLSQMDPVERRERRRAQQKETSAQRRREQGATPRANLAEMDPIVRMQRRRQQHRRHVAMRVSLPDVLAQYQKLDGRHWSRFRDWLLLEIAARSGAPSNDKAEAAE